MEAPGVLVYFMFGLPNEIAAILGGATYFLSTIVFVLN